MKLFTDFLCLLLILALAFGAAYFVNWLVCDVLLGDNERE
jgi:hypothetical protein